MSRRRDLLYFLRVKLPPIESQCHLDLPIRVLDESYLDILNRMEKPRFGLGQQRQPIGWPGQLQPCRVLFFDQDAGNPARPGLRILQHKRRELLDRY